jgi:hypothetical protein
LTKDFSQNIQRTLSSEYKITHFFKWAGDLNRISPKKIHGSHVKRCPVSLVSKEIKTQ